MQACRAGLYLQPTMHCLDTSEFTSQQQLHSALICIVQHQSVRICIANTAYCYKPTAAEDAAGAFGYQCPS